MAKIKIDVKEETHEETQKAFTVKRTQGGWEFVTITFQGKEILGIERSETDLKAIILEKFKIAAFKYWSALG